MLRYRSTRSIHALSPATTQALVSQFAHRDEYDAASMSSESPDSLYSSGSPTFADQAFEFDSVSGDMEVEERDEDDYESIMGSMDGRDVGPDESGSDRYGQGWSRWPEAGLGADMGWTPSPVAGGRKGSIISISPRGSISASTKAASSSGRRPSTPCSKLRYDNGEERRDSNPSLLGFDLAQRRSSVRSISSSRRRSSVLSNGSVMDPLEDARLRNIASMDQLRRRFSEVVEVTMASDSEAESSYQDSYGSQTHHASIARAALQSPWSPETCTDDDDEDSELMTAPYVPTPDMPARRPLLLSNYPLPSAVRDELPYERPLDTPSELSVAPSPMMPPARPRVISQTLLATPPPPARPRDILRGRQRPAFPRAATDYQFPPRSDGVPAGAGPPRPTLARAISTPFFSTPQRSQPIAILLATRAAGSFPSGQSAPLATSPLKASVRRQSLSIESGPPRRASLMLGEHGEVRRSSLEPRRMSMDSRRPSVAERRMSIVNGTCAPPRRLSNDTRRSSIAQASNSSRRSSSGSVRSRRDSAVDARRPSADRRSSMASRKSSVVSVGEYGYLAPQIVVDLPTPAIPSIPSMTSTPTEAPTAAPATRLRANAPSSIALPLPFTATLAAHSPAATTPCGTSRFNPLETFLGMSSVGPYTPSLTPGSADLFTPRGDVSGMFDVTPKPSPSSVLDRPRPISPPEFRDSFPLSPRRWQDRTSPKVPHRIADTGSGSSDTCVENGMASGSSDTHVELEADREHEHEHEHEQGHKKSPLSFEAPALNGPRLNIVRKAVPQLTEHEMHASPPSSESDSMKRDRATRGHQRNYYRRGAVELFTPSDATLPRPPMTRRAVSVQGHGMRTDVIRPVIPRQTTLQDTSGLQSHAQSQNQPRSAPAPRPGHNSPGNRYPRTATVTFAPQPDSSLKDAKPLIRPPIARATSGSTLSRFFHGRSRSSSATPPPVPPPAPMPEPKAVRPSLRPVSMEGYHGSYRSEGAMVDVRDVLRRIGGSPKSPKSPRDVSVSAHVARAVG